MVKKLIRRKACITQTDIVFYSSAIKHVHIFEVMIWHVQQDVFKCFMIPLPRFSNIYGDLFTLRKKKL